MQARACTNILGDFEKPETMLLYTERTDGCGGEPVDGIEPGKAYDPAGVAQKAESCHSMQQSRDWRQTHA